MDGGFLMAITEEAVRRIRDQKTLLEFFERELHWPLPENPVIDDVTFEWTAADLRLSASAQQHLAHGSIKQLRPVVDGQPWGVFLVNFTDGQVYRTALRQVLRGLVPKRRRDAKLPGWQHENLLFICMTANQEFTFAHFRGEKPERAKLARFSWSPEEPVRTLCEFNLPALGWPEEDLIGIDPSDWLHLWSTAFDVEKVTAEFFREYRRVFENAEDLIRGIKGDEKRLFTQKLFNRLLFVRFLEKKDWLKFNDRTDYLRSLWEDYKMEATKGSSFYRDRLRLLFFSGLNAPNEVNQIGINRGGFLAKVIGRVPYLNGGLFEQDETDQNDKIIVPDKAIEPAFTELLYHFNFTVTESTPLDVTVAVDPEMLGRIFEELVTGRHETGSYYTPRTIVSFMCREALKGYLDGWEKLIEERDASGISVPQARELLIKIAKITVVDPACGSGAYLLGMLHELHDITKLLDTRTDKPSAKDDYERKLNIIQNTLYGVDIDPFATNIARLRLWLSLAVDFEGNDPPPLPNLDFKIEVGDSLTAPNPQDIPDLFRNVLLDHADKIAVLKGEHMRAHHEVKKQRAAEILKEEEELTKALRDSPAPKGSFDWRVRFAEVFRNDGFNVVLANPPYGVTCEDPLRFQYFPKVKGEDPQSKDSYGLFMARALQLLKSGGIFTFIVSDTWRTIRTHRPLRKHLLTKTVLHVLDLPSWIFKATVNTCILSLRNERAPENHQLVAGDLRSLPAGEWTTLDANLAAVSAHGVDLQTTTYARYTYPQKLIASSSNLPIFIGSPKLFAVMVDDKEVVRKKRTISDKEEKTIDVRQVSINGKVIELFNFSAVGDVVGGVMTSDNDSYLKVADSTSRSRSGYEVVDQNLVVDFELTPGEKEHGIDKRKRHQWFVRLDKGGVAVEETLISNYYRETEYYLDWSRESVSALKKANGLRNHDRYFDLGLVYSEAGIYSPTFRLSTGHVFAKASPLISSQSCSPPELLGLFCSRWSKFVFKAFMNHSVHTVMEDILEFPLVHTDKWVFRSISKLVQAIVMEQKKDPTYPYYLHEQPEIDRLIYEIYGLDTNDIREVELWFCRRYPKLAEAQGVQGEAKDKYAGHLARCEMILSKPPGYWTSHPILTLIAQGEGAQLEFKETLEYVDQEVYKQALLAKHVPEAQIKQKYAETAKEVVHSSLKTICAFLNANGGTLLIGVSDSGEVKGLDGDYKLCNKHDKDGFELKLRAMISSRFKPQPLGSVDVAFEELPEGTVCVVKISPVAKPEVIHLDNEVFVRDGNQSPSLEGQALTNWVTERVKG
jgi:type I restriction-modification system DNA methylase subunit